MKKTIALALAALMLLALLTACAAKPAETEPAELEQTVQTEQPAEPETDETAEDADASAEEETPAEPEQPAEPALPDGVYTADFNTDSSMFHANEACDGKGTLTVENGEMTIHVSLAGTSILNLFPGVKEDAEKEGAELLQPTTDTVTYPTASPTRSSASTSPFLRWTRNLTSRSLARRARGTTTRSPSPTPFPSRNPARPSTISPWPTAPTPPS